MKGHPFGSRRTLSRRLLTVHQAVTSLLGSPALQVPEWSTGSCWVQETPASSSAEGAREAAPGDEGRWRSWKPWASGQGRRIEGGVPSLLWAYKVAFPPNSPERSSFSGKGHRRRSPRRAQVPELVPGLREEGPGPPREGLAPRGLSQKQRLLLERSHSSQLSGFPCVRGLLETEMNKESGPGEPDQSTPGVVRWP